MKKLIAIVLLSTHCYSVAEELPVASFGHMPIITQPEVSPNGDFVTAVMNVGEVPTVVVSPFGSNELTTILRLENADDRIEWIAWANSERLLVSASFSVTIGNDRNRSNRLYAVDRTGQNLREIRRKTAQGPSRLTRFLDNDHVLAFLPDEPNHILMQVYDASDRARAVFKVDIYKNKFTKQFANTYNVHSWVADANGTVRLGIGTRKQTSDTRLLWHRTPGTKKWELLHERELFSDETFSPLVVAGDKLFVLSDHELRRQALWQYDIPTGEFEEIVYSVEGYDLGGGILSTDRTHLDGVYYYDDFQQRHYFDKDEGGVDAFVKQTLSQFETSVVSRDRSGNRLIVAAVRDDTPRKYVWLDVAAKKGGIWFSQYPHLEGKSLAKVTPFEYEARDGMQLNGYLTLPVQATDVKPALVVFPHGGPHSRDYQYFDPFVQFFANRGFAVLQMNFRGSEGFNSDYLVAGYREWGQAMQNDVYDAIDWLQDQGSVDTSRACVVGGSYGGYVALTAAFQRPDDFQCLISFAGISNLLKEVEHETRFDNSLRIIVRTQIGDPRDEDQKRSLKENSAINHLDKINAPILLVHGTRDTQVQTDQSRDFYSRAKDAGLDVEYLQLELGTHYFDDNTNRLPLFQAMDEFLKEHLN